MARKKAEQEVRQEALQAAQDVLTQAHETMATLQAEKAELVAKAGQHEAILNREPNWESVEQASQELKKEADSRDQLRIYQGLIANIDVRIAVAADTVEGAEDAVKDGHTEVLLVERRDKLAAMIDTVTKLHADLDDWAQLNQHLVGLGRQADHSMKLLAVPVARTVDAFAKVADETDAPRHLNPHKETGRLQRHLKKAKQRLATAMRLPDGISERQHAVLQSKATIKDLEQRLQDIEDGKPVEVTSTMITERQVVEAGLAHAEARLEKLRSMPFGDEVAAMIRDIDKVIERRKAQLADMPEL